MKIAKISIAALVALSALAQTASATPLEEAIKDVDFSGFARYRYTYDNKKPSNADRIKNNAARNEFKFIGNFKAKFDDNFFGVLGLRYLSKDGSGTQSDATNTTQPFTVKQFYLGYKINNTTVQAGKQIIKTFFTDDLVGTGVVAYNTDVDGLTISAFAFDALAIDTDYDGNLIPKLTQYNMGTNVYGLGLAGNFDPVAFQLWLANMPHTATLVGTELKVNAPIADDVKLGVQAQYVSNFMNNEMATKTPYKDARFYAVKANADFFGANLNAGYINFRADEGGTGFVTLEDNGDLINPAKILNSSMGGTGNTQYYNNLKDTNHFWFVGAGYKFDKYALTANYIDGKGYSYGLNTAKAKRKEANVSASYAYSKKLKFSGFFATAKDKKDGNSYKQNRIRFETKYSF
ncbi:major outer membrane protein [Campylobacter sp. 19-13652]|uniref:major outer membrane protein n=1 Tax=Campylobacter sp. 19-13652 TaxID=2840180 RepID=UPI001C776D38|nr:major outer membrane protein [Campylobacter sp. 19-13652]BCX79690.1 major outer membrane protein [Campylobacter sp. 19-13652]